MASSDDATPVGSGSTGTIFDQLHTQSGGSLPKTVFDKLHQQAQAQPVSAPAQAVDASPTTDSGVPASTAPSPLAKGPSAGGFLSNAVDSAGNFAKGLGSAATLAAGAGEKLGNVASFGLAHKGSGGELPEEQQFDLVAHNVLNHPIETAKDVGQYVVDRYGGWEKAKQTAYEDPVGFMADLSAVLGGGSSALKVAGKVGQFAKLSRTADVLSSLGDIAGKGSQLANPLNIPGKVATAVGGKAMTGAARSIYQGALKPSVTNGAADNAAITEMGLKEGIPLNGKTAQAGQDLAATKQIPTNQAIAGSAAQIDPNNVAAIATAKFKPKLSSAANPGNAPDVFDANMQDYLTKHTPPPSGPLNSRTGPAPYPIQDAQAEKIATYDKAANSYGKDQGVSPEQTATKALAFGIKTAMEQFIPELKGLNDTEATAIGLKGALENFAAREGNSGKLMRYFKPSLASGIAAGGAGAYEHSLPVAIGAHLATKALEDPTIQSRIAIALYKGANNSSTPYIRQAMTPAARIAEVQQHIQDMQKKGVRPSLGPPATPAPQVTAVPVPQASAKPPRSPSTAPAASTVMPPPDTHPALADLPQPAEAAQNANLTAQQLSQLLSHVGQHLIHAANAPVLPTTNAPPVQP